MKGDQMGIRAAYPTPLELPLSNRTWFNAGVPDRFDQGLRDAAQAKSAGHNRHPVPQQAGQRCATIRINLPHCSLLQKQFKV
jgi:hypothetical protein